MRNGRLLAEDSPDNMLLEHNLTSLEEVFLKLCMAESGSDDTNENVAAIAEPPKDVIVCILVIECDQ